MRLQIKVNQKHTDQRDGKSHRHTLMAHCCIFVLLLSICYFVFVLLFVFICPQSAQNNLKQRICHRKCQKFNTLCQIFLKMFIETDFSEAVLLYAVISHFY